LRVFGCTAYAHVDNGKLEPRAAKCIFLGYQPGVKGYKLWNPQTRKVVLSRNIIFNESAMFYDNLSVNAPVEGEKISVQVEHLIDAADVDNVIVQDVPIAEISLIIDDSSIIEHSSLVMQSPQYSIATDRQSPRQWYKRFDSFILSYGFKRSYYDSCVYSKIVNGSAIYLLFYVDDMLIAAKDK
jgi:hypothetical protein